MKYARCMAAAAWFGVAAAAAFAGEPAVFRLEAGQFSAGDGFSAKAAGRALALASTRVFYPKPGTLPGRETLPVAAGRLAKLAIRCEVSDDAPGAGFEPALRFLNDAGDTVGYARWGGFDSPFPGLYPGQHRAPAPVAAPGEAFLFEGYAAVPAGATKLRCDFLFHGNPVAMRVHDLSVTFQDAEDAPPEFIAPPPFDAAPLSDAELDARLAARTRPTLATRTNGDTVETLLDGEPYPLRIYKNTPYIQDRAKTPAMVEAGFNLFTAHAALGLPGHVNIHANVWREDGGVDVEVLRRAMRDILRYAPDALVMLEINVSPRAGWAEAHPDEIFQYEDGRKGVMRGSRVAEYTNEPPDNSNMRGHTRPYWVPSFYSEIFRADAADALGRALAELERHPEANALAAVFLTGGTDGQWFDLHDNRVPGARSLLDYSPPSLRHFRAFLRRKYDGDAEQLRAAWGDDDADFDTVALPTMEALWPPDGVVLRKAGGRDAVADFLESRGDGMAESFLAYCRAVKEASGGRVLAGGYRAEGAATSFPLITQACSGKMHAAPEADFFASCPGGRSAAMPIWPALLNGSLRLRGKLAVTELDLRNPEVRNWGPWRAALYYKTHDAAEFARRVKRSALFAAAYGGTYHAYDMDGNWYDSPAARAAWGEANRLTGLRRPRPLADDRVALFYDERYWDHMALNGTRSFAHVVVNQPRQAIEQSGVPYDLYLLDDARHPGFAAPKVLVFANALSLTPADAAEIRRRHANGGRALVWLWAPGAGAGDDAAMSAVAGFGLRRAPEADGKPVLARRSKNPLMAGVENLVRAAADPFGLGPVWRVDDPGAEIVGVYHGTDIPAMAVKRYADHMEIFVGQGGALTPRLVANIADLAGVRRVAAVGDPVAATGGQLILSAARAGVKTLRPPPGFENAEITAGQAEGRAAATIKINVAYDELAILATGR